MIIHNNTSATIHAIIMRGYKIIIFIEITSIDTENSSEEKKYQKIERYIKQTTQQNDIYEEKGYYTLIEFPSHKALMHSFEESKIAYGEKADYIL